MTPERETVHSTLVRDHDHTAMENKIKIEPDIGSILLPTSVHLRA